jgi:integrase
VAKAERKQNATPRRHKLRQPGEPQGVDRVGIKFRACKEKEDEEPLKGPLRDTWEEAAADLPGLVWDRRKKGSGGVEKYGDKHRARKERKGKPTLVGPLRDTRAEAKADLPDLDWLKPEAEIPTFGGFMGRLLSGDRQKEVSLNAYKKDHILWRTRVRRSELGRKKLDEISAEDVQAWIDEQTVQLRFVADRDDNGKLVWQEVGEARYIRGHHEQTEKPLSFETRCDYLIKIKGYLDRARKRPYKYIQVNPAADLFLRRSRRETKIARRPRVLAPRQAASLKGGLLKFTTTLREQKDRFMAMVLTQLDTGLRRGELCGMPRDNVRKSDETYYIVVDRALSKGTKGFTLGPTKTGNVREIPIKEETYKRIRALPSRPVPADYDVPSAFAHNLEGGFAFSTRSGRPESPDNYCADFRAFAKAMGLPNLKPHALRATFISLWLRKADMKTVMDMVGHQDERMIARVYAEMSRESAVKAAQDVAAMMRWEEERLEEEEKRKQAGQEDTGTDK